MTPSCLSLALLVLLAADPAAPRPPHPFAPSLPQLTDEDEQRFDQVIDRFILYDIGKLKGAEGQKALADFQKLGPEATFALIRGLNRSAAIESSCPAVVIAKKLNTILRSSRDTELLEFARENIGLAVGPSRHLGVLKELRAVCVFRKAEVLRSGSTALRTVSPGGKSPQRMTLAELTRAAETERGEKLRPILQELERRDGEEALTALAAAAGSYDRDTQKVGGELLDASLARHKPAALKERLGDDRPGVRAAAARAVGARGLRYGTELIALLDDDEPDVRDAARAALVRLSRGSDFGPERNAGAADRKAAVERWRAWWAQQSQR